MKRYASVLGLVLAIVGSALAAPTITTFSRQNWNPDNGPASIIHPGETGTWLLTGSDLDQISGAALVDAYTGVTNSVVSVTLGGTATARTVTIAVPASANGGGYQLRLYAGDQTISLPDGRIEIIPSVGITQIVPTVTSMIRQDYFGQTPLVVRTGTNPWWELFGSNLNLVNAAYLVNTTTDQRNFNITATIAPSDNNVPSLRIAVPPTEPAGMYKVRLSTGTFEVDIPNQIIQVAPPARIVSFKRHGEEQILSSDQQKILADQRITYVMEGMNLDQYRSAWLDNDRGRATDVTVTLDPVGINPPVQASSTMRAFTVEARRGATPDRYTLRLEQTSGEINHGRLEFEVAPPPIPPSPVQAGPMPPTAQGQGPYDIMVTVPYAVGGFAQTYGLSGSSITGLRNVWFIVSAHKSNGDTIGWGVGDISNRFPVAPSDHQTGSIDVGINLPPNTTNSDFRFIRVRTWLGNFNGQMTELREPDRTFTGPTQNWAAVKNESITKEDPANENLIALEGIGLQQVGIVSLVAIAPGTVVANPQDATPPIISGVYHSSGNGVRVSSTTLLAREAATGYIELRGTNLGSINGGFVRNSSGQQTPDISVMYGPVSRLADGTETRIVSVAMANSDVRGNYSLVILGGRCPECGAPLEHSIADYTITATFRPFEPVRRTTIIPFRVIGWHQ